MLVRIRLRSGLPITGTEDRLIEPNRKFLDWLTTKSIKFTRIETPGTHTWLVWRRDLANFAPLLFQDSGTQPPACL